MTETRSGYGPDERAILAHLVWLIDPVRHDLPDLRLEIGWGAPDQGPAAGRTFQLNEVEAAARFATWINLKGCNVYVGATLKRADTPEKGRTSAADAALAVCLTPDIDTHFASVAARAADLAMPQLLVLTGVAPAPRGQLSIRIEPTSDLTACEEILGRIVRRSGADENALGRNRLVRLAGTRSYPSSKKIARGYVQERTSAHFIPGPQYAISDLLAAIPPIVSAPSVASLSIGHPANTGSLRRTAKPTLRAVEIALQTVPDRYSDERGLWIKVGFALYDFDPGPTGQSLWRRFSLRCPKKAVGTDFSALWAGFGRPYTGNRITIGWLLREARKPTL